MEYIYVDRAKCQCGYIWTTPGVSPPDTISDSVICKCGSLEFVKGVLNGESLIITEEDFKQAVADDTNLDINNLTITKY